MNRKLISPCKRQNAVNDWFRLAIPPHYRASVGLSEITNLLGATDLRAARQRRASLHSDWLVKPLASRPWHGGTGFHRVAVVDRQGRQTPIPVRGPVRGGHAMAPRHG